MAGDRARTAGLPGGAASGLGVRMGGFCVHFPDQLSPVPVARVAHARDAAYPASAVLAGVPRSRCARYGGAAQWLGLARDADDPAKVVLAGVLGSRSAR